MGRICTERSVGISVDVNPFEPHILASNMAHAIGHNLGFGHDDSSSSIGSFQHEPSLMLKRTWERDSWDFKQSISRMGDLQFG